MSEHTRPNIEESALRGIKSSMGELFHNRLVTARTDIPIHTDIDAPVPYRQNKRALFGQQEGRCNGYRSEFPFRDLTIDHIIPERRGGTDYIENLMPEDNISIAAAPDGQPKLCTLGNTRTGTWVLRVCCGLPPHT